VAGGGGPVHLLRREWLLPARTRLEDGGDRGCLGVSGGTAETVAAAHQALVDDPSIQFTLSPLPPPAKPPHWLEGALRWLGDLLRPLGRLLRWLGGLLPDAPYARILLWGTIAVLVLLFLWAAVERLRHGRWHWPRWRRRSVAAAVEADQAEDWRPEAGPLRRWLDEADALAAAGRYAEAVHHLLFRSVEDIARHRPGAVRPALTSRELARAAAIPPGARAPFARIAAEVERSLFGGRPLAERDWQAARAAYGELVRPQAWAGG